MSKYSQEDYDDLLAGRLPARFQQPSNYYGYIPEGEDLIGYKHQGRTFRGGDWNDVNNWVPDAPEKPRSYHGYAYDEETPEEEEGPPLQRQGHSGVGAVKAVPSTQSPFSTVAPAKDQAGSQLGYFGFAAIAAVGLLVYFKQRANNISNPQMNVALMNIINAKNILFIVLGVDLALVSLVGINSFISIGILEQVVAGVVIADAAMIDRLTFWESASKLILLSMLAVGVAIVYWLKTSYRHAHEVIGATDFKQEGWVFWGWVIPVLNLFKPYQVIMELYRAGGRQYYTPDGWKDGAGSGVMLFWWIVYVVLHFMMVMAFNMFNQATGAMEITWRNVSMILRQSL